MKRLNKGRSTRLIDTTSKIYSKVCKEVGWSREALMIEKLATERTISDAEVEEIRERIDQLYCKYLIEQATYILEDLLTAHVGGQIKRAPRTLDAVQKELLERVVNEAEERDRS